MILGMFAAAAGGAPELWTPADTDTQAWYDVQDASTLTLSSGRITQLRDKSGHGFHLSPGAGASGPGYSTTAMSGHAAAVFNGSNTNLRRSLLVPFLSDVSGATVFAVTTVNASASALDYLILLLFPNGNAKLSVELGRTAGRMGVGGRRIESDSFQVVTGSSEVGIGPRIHSNVLNYTSANGDIYLDGTLDGSATFQSPGNSSSTNPSALVVGSSFDNLNWWFGLVAEIVILPVAATSDIRQRVEGYLAWRRGLQGSLPAEHPYKAAPPMVE